VEDQLDRVLMARLMLDENADPVFGWLKAHVGSSRPSSLSEKALTEYLLRTWKRCADRKQLLDRSKHAHQWQALEKLQALCVSYYGILLKYPDMFPQPPAVTSAGSGDVLKEKIILDEESASAIPHDFLEVTKNKVY
jgi:hypothetical protein